MSKSNNQAASQVTPGVTVLNEESFKTLEGMIRSNDEGDHKMAQLILVQVNIKESIYWIWKLARTNVNRMVNLRTKAGREFRDACNLFYISNAGSTTFGSWLIKKQWMTDEIYMYLKNDLINHEKRSVTSVFFKHTIQLKDELKHFDPTDQPTTVSREITYGD